MNWLDEVKWDANGLVPGIAQEAASGAVLVAVQLAGAWGWVVAGPILALLLALALRLAPFLFARLGRVRPLDRPSLTARLSTLAARARIPVVGIDEWVVDESSPATALVTGVGPTRRILFARQCAAVPPMPAWRRHDTVS